MPAYADANQHYDASYFALTKGTASYSAEIDLFKFNDEVGPDDRLVDFGCGGGFILAALTARAKIGVEINETSANAARRRGLTIVRDLDAIEDCWADTIISHHALEHVDDPLGTLRAAFAKLRPGGKIVLVTPSETVRMRYREDDPNFHLFTWSPGNLGNLLKRAGFIDISAAPVHHRWPPYWFVLRRFLPLPAMQTLSYIHSRLRTEIGQTKAVGYRPR